MPGRTPEGDALTALVLPAFALNGEFLEAAAVITAPTTEQHAWADAVGQEIGEKDLKTLATLISRVTEASRRYRQAAEEEPLP